MTYNQSTIHFGNLQEVQFNELLKNQFGDSKKIILTDETISELWISHLITSFSELARAEIIQIPSGEENKTLGVCEQIWEVLSEYEISRSDLIINFGGGVITDMGGLIASLFKRGLTFINIPTTLLAQVDASIGGKTAIDLGPYKNQIGVFSDAKHVFIDDQFLTTLADEQLYSAYAEMLKHGLIADPDYWEKLKSFDPKKPENRLKYTIQSVNIKKSIIEQDYKEKSLRKILNFGHTIGHGVEGFLLNNNTPTLHGYAVAWGMRAESFISYKKGFIAKDEFNDINSHLEKVFPKFEIDPIHFKTIIQLLYNDKKNNSGQIQFSLISNIGKGIYNQNVTDIEIIESLKMLTK